MSWQSGTIAAVDIGADEDEETSVDVLADELEEDTPTDHDREAIQRPQKPAHSHTEILASRPSSSPSERPSRIPGLKFRVQGDTVGRSISPPRARKTTIETLPPGVGPSAHDHLPLQPEGTITKPRLTSAPPPPPTATAADLNYQRVVQLRRELRAVKTLQNKHERELLALRARAEIFEEQLLKLASEPKNTGTPAADHQLLRKVALLEDRTVIQQSAISEANATSAARFADLSKRLESLEVTWARRSVSSPNITAVDDLKRIKGIGPKFEMLLHDAGITKFEQIAAWSDEDIERIAEKIGTSSVRIERDEWVASARRLIGKK